ncbi:MAG: ribonuclease HII [Chitinophagaceae bacterium]|nr:ribonuclease HII [Chitinophagaceae bacterium]
MLAPYYHNKLIEAGCDEAGRGCYAGPVFAAAVILPKDFYHPLLNDSKKVTEKNRLLLKEYIENAAISWAVAKIDHTEIDKINILKASFKAMHFAIKALKQEPEFLLIDGNRFMAYPNIPHITIVKGDGKYASIAAASILAKTHRDAYMKKLDKIYPAYHWGTNKGYGTLDHRKAIAEIGLCKYHRKSFDILPKQESLFPNDDLR